MLGGGHFAGAVFRGKEVLVHKTFHAYTVRAKQGGSQGSADNKYTDTERSWLKPEFDMILQVWWKSS